MQYPTSPLLRMSVAACLLFLAAPTLAAPPAVTRVSPAGVRQGTTATLGLVGKLNSRPVSVWCSREDITLAISEEKEELTVTVPDDATPGRCWLRLYNAEGATDLIPLHIGLLTEIVESEPNNRVSEATSVPELPATASGVLHRGGEVDMYSVAVNAGQTLIAAVDAREAIGSPMDPVLQIVSESGFVLEQNDDWHGVDPLIAYTSPTDQRLCVRIFAFPSTPNSSISFAGGSDYVYRLTLTTGPFISHVIGGNEPPQLVGWNLHDSPADPRAIPGFHHSLQLEPLGPRPDRSSEDEPFPITRGQTLSGIIRSEGATEDWRLAGTKGETLRFQVVALDKYSPLDPVLRITDTAGKSLRELDDISRTNRDINFTWKVPDDGDYTVSIRDRFGRGGERFVYELTIDTPQPSVELSVEASHFTLKDKREIPVTIERTGFDRPLTISVEDLPEGVSAEPVTSEPKGDSSKKVTLTLRAESATPFQGPLRIIARSPESEEVLTPAAPSPLPRGKVTDLWLTVTQ